MAYSICCEPLVQSRKSPFQKMNKKEHGGGDVSMTRVLQRDTQLAQAPYNPLLLWLCCPLSVGGGEKCRETSCPTPAIPPAHKDACAHWQLSSGISAEHLEGHWRTQGFQEYR